MNTIPVKRALISVSDKRNVVDFARGLVELGIDIISTGGTSQQLAQAHIPFRPVETVTGLPEMLDGRVKTLHPRIHGGILGRRDEHAVEAAQHQIDWIDLVVVNFYPFADAMKKNPEMSWDDMVEYIDIGGPTMVRAAAKNFAWVGVVVDPTDYTRILDELRVSQGLKVETRKYLAEKAFALTSQYDATIHQHLMNKGQAVRECPEHLELRLEKLAELRYGENPHQRACAYHFQNQHTGILFAAPHQGKVLSYNNFLDADAAWACVSEFVTPACVIVKHANPCGAATAGTIEEAYRAAYETDAQAAFGGIVALNRPCTKSIAEAISQIFMEVILAPAFTEEALAILATKPNMRVLEMPTQLSEQWEMKFITGGLLLQEKNLQTLTVNDLKTVTRSKPGSQEIDDMLFAWRVLKHVKSNGILLAKNKATIGIGGGQVSRINAVEMAIQKANGKIQDCILASDAFFPFRDSIDRLANTGVRAIIQPGGSMRDEEVIAACDEHGIAMMLTGQRCFRH